MPFNERVFLLDSRNGESRIFEVNYDFQGLKGNAKLTHLITSTTIPSGGHMTMSPNNKYLTIVVSRLGKIFLVDIDNGNVRELQIFNQNPMGIGDNQIHFDNNRWAGKNFKITQVDVDQDGFLFLAGKSGFYKVVADNLNGSDPSIVSNADIWADTDPSLDGAFAGQVWVHAIPFTFSGEAYVETTEDGEDYFETTTPFDPKKVKFLGGDILFTQNSTETDGFESQRLLSFSQWKGNVAIALDLNFNWATKTITFNASQVFGGNGHPFNRNYVGKDGKKTERVTGAALIGDNQIMTSHHQRDFFSLFNLHGDLLARVPFEFDGEKFKGDNTTHFWGDMTSTQYFDKNTLNPDALSNNEIDGEYFDDWYRGTKPGHQYAEIKLYRPGSGMQKDPNNLSEDEYNNTSESRPNAANADIADYRKNAAKFVSLGKDGGYVLMRFPAPITVTESTVLQVVETSWNRLAQYTNINDAFAAYPEKVNVFVLKGETPRYYTAGLEKHTEHDWAYVGKASIANNEFDLSDVANGNGSRDHLVRQTIQWIMIRDTDSTTPDGFDLNFVSIYDNR